MCQTGKNSYSKSLTHILKYISCVVGGAGRPIVQLLKSKVSLLGRINVLSKFHGNLPIRLSCERSCKKFKIGKKHTFDL